MVKGCGAGIFKTEYLARQAYIQRILKSSNEDIYRRCNRCTAISKAVEKLSMAKRHKEVFINKIIQLETVTENNLSKILKDSSDDIKIRYAAFFAMCTIYRRNKDYTLYGNLLREYEEAFKDFKSILHLKSMHLVEFADTEDEILKKSLRKLLKN